MSTINERIIPLDEMDAFEVADGDPDVRGWQVYARDGVRIGSVDELLVDTAALKVRYLDVELEEAEGETEGRHVLIPVGIARLHETDDHILVDALDSTAVTDLPSYAQEPLTRDLEAAVLRQFQLGIVANEEAPDPYAGDAYDEDRFYGARRGRGEG